MDRREMIAYLEAKSPAAAILVDDRIDSAMELLADFPDAGRLGQFEGTRELVIQDTPYIAAYRVETPAIVVLRLIHAARKWPESLPTAR